MTRSPFTMAELAHTLTVTDPAPNSVGMPVHIPGHGVITDMRVALDGRSILGVHAVHVTSAAVNEVTVVELDVHPYYASPAFRDSEGELAIAGIDGVPVCTPRPEGEETTWSAVLLPDNTVGVRCQIYVSRIVFE